MKNIIVKKATLVNTLHKNREAYKKLYDVSLQNYRKKSIHLLNKEIENLDSELENENVLLNEFSADIENSIKELKDKIKKLQELKKEACQNNEEFKEKIQNYKKIKSDLRDKLADESNDISDINLIECPIEKPKDHSDDYNRVIELMKHLAHEEIELEKEECDRYIMNQWDWKRGFINSFSNDNHYRINYKSEPDYREFSISSSDMYLKINNILAKYISKTENNSFTQFSSNGKNIGMCGPQGSAGIQGHSGSSSERLDIGSDILTSYQVNYDSETEMLIQEF